MDLAAFAERAEASGLGEWMRTSLKAMPVVESIHVMALALVFGTILIVDLRLLGFASTRRPFTRVSGELLKLTWAGFIVSVITGAMMFTANATTYYDNTAFRLKLLALLAAGVNMAVFHLWTMRNVSAWDKDAVPPVPARAAGALSIAIWVAVIVCGRVIGFTKGYDFDVPEDLDFDFSTQLDSSLFPPESGGQ
ncbi:MAG TPA: DUF6644 family protein [Gammaproteobacteria bacterium]